MKETAKEFFNRIIQESKSNAFKKNMEHVKIACDEITRMNGTFNCSQVIKYIGRHFKSPGRSAIRNNTPSGKRYRCYIDLRKLEHCATQPKDKKATSPSHVIMPPGISAMAENYILQLQAEVQTLSKLNQFLSQEYTQRTKKNPIQFSAMIADGPETDGSMTVIPTSQPTTPPLSVEALQGLRNLIALGDNINSPLKFTKKKNAALERMILETPSITEIVLFEDQLQEIRNYLKRLDVEI